MVIFHFKHSHLNWRVIPCKRRWFVFMRFFIIFSTFFFWLSWFSFRLNLNFQVHDTTIIFLFVFFFHNSSTLGNDARHRWLSKLKHLFLCKDCFERVGFFLVQSCLGHFCSKRGSWLKSISKKWAILVNVPQGINQGDFKISRSWDFAFLVIDGFW